MKNKPKAPLYLKNIKGTRITKENTPVTKVVFSKEYQTRQMLVFPFYKPICKF